MNTDINQAERNRPTNLSPAASVRRNPVQQAFADWVAEQVANGLDPRAVGEQVLDAIRSERFYVLTHPEWQPLIEHRMKTLLSAGNPTALQPPVGVTDA